MRSAARAHTQRVSTIRCERHGEVVNLLLEATADPQVEIWDANRESRLFEQVFGVRLQLAWSDRDRSSGQSAAVRTTSGTTVIGA